ncbi:MAG TPA: UbiH/UbiF/VisC/COQ6 family ubiquinone biosynthesis hydroxylase [Pseudomonadales bacterium]|nr:UbiH/UbiF/VisC/COQ6 family ubiquinone biosynthesis hydroxylase [Pseudomonadales bacterium]
MTGTHDRLDCDIAIVGGAMAGSALACALAGSAYRVIVIENQQATAFTRDNFFDARVVALSAASQQFLEKLGVWQDIYAQRVSPYEHMQVWDAEGTAHIAFDCADVQQPALGYIVENSLIVDALQKKLQQADNIQWLCPASVADLRGNDPQASTCELVLHDKRTVHARLVVAADGAVSTLRNLADIKIMEWDYGHTAIVATVKTAVSHQRTARQRFMASGPLAFLPLRANDGDEHWSSIVWSIVPEQAQALLDLPEAEFAGKLDQAIEHRLGEILEVRNRFAFPLRQRHAQVYYRDHVVLIGDAAHTIHPLAGQGVNLGFMDVKALAEELLSAHARGIAVAHSSVLQRYQRRRRGDNLTMTAVMEMFKRVFSRKELPVRWLRNAGMRSLDALPLAKREIMRRAMGLP